MLSGGGALPPSLTAPRRRCSLRLQPLPAAFSLLPAARHPGPSRLLPMPGAARAQPAGYKADLRGPPGAAWRMRPSLALLRAQGCAADETEEGTMESRPRAALAWGSEARVTRSHATSRQRRVWLSSQRPRPGEAGGGATGQSTPPRALILGAVHKLWKLPEGRPTQGETPSQDTGDPGGTPHGSMAPPPGQECEQQGQRGDALFFPPASSGFPDVSWQQAGQTASGSGKDSTINQGVRDSSLAPRAPS